MNPELLKEALYYLKNGINVLTTDASKTSIPKWTRYQKELATPADIKEQLKNPKAMGIAIVCGAVSGGLEVIDVDLKYDLTGTLWTRLVDRLKEADLFQLFKISKTRNGGYHLLYRCEVIEGNQPLASRPKTDEEQINNPSKKGIVLIETRGEKGYIVAPPSEGYEWVSGTLKILTIDQRELLFEICRSFNEVVEPPKHSRETKVETRGFGLSPFEDYNKRGDVIGLLEKHGWTIVRDDGKKVVFKRPGKSDSKSSGDFNRQLNWFSVFTTNSAFDTKKAYLPYAVYTVLECNGNFSAASKKLTSEGYGEKYQKFGEKMEKEVFKMKREGAEKESIIKMVHKNHSKSEEEASEIIEILEKQWGEEVATFWDVSASGKVTINIYKLQRFLSNVGGFYLYFYDSATRLYKLIRMKDGFVEESSPQQIKSFIKEYIMSLPDSFDGGLTPEMLIEIIYKGQGTYFNDNVLEFMDVINPEFLKSERDTAYFPFNNGVITVHKDEITLKSYSELKKAIWRNQVIDFDIIVDQDFDVSKSEFYDFLRKISGDDFDRLSYCLSIIGYLLHAYKDAARPYAVILAEETENNEDGGGTGKGIFVKALSHILRTVKVDGKNFKIDKSFALQRVSLDTQLISIEDCNKHLDFELFNSQITEGSTIEKKNKDELFIDYRDSPKFVFSTNYMLNLKGNHGKRRSKVFEFAPFFGPEKTPMSHFGHLLFDEWNRDEWIRFYNLMFSCVSIYLQAGIKKMEQTDMLKRKTIRTSYGDEFLEWLIDFINPKNGNLGKSKMQMELYNGFVVENGFTQKDYSIKRFKSALIMSGKLLNIEMKFLKTRAGKEVIIGVPDLVKSSENNLAPENQNLAPVENEELELFNY